MAPLRSSDVAVNSNSWRARQLGPTKSYGKDPLSLNPLYDTPTRPPRRSGKENSSGNFANIGFTQPEAPRKLGFFPNPRAVLYSPIKLRPQSSPSGLWQERIPPYYSNTLGLFHTPSFGDGPSTTSLCLDQAAQGSHDDVSADLDVGESDHHQCEVASGTSSPIHDGASDDLGAFYEAGCSQAGASLAYGPVGSPASVNTEIVSPSAPDRWREEAYFALRKSPELPGDHGPPSPTVSEVLLHLPKIGSHNSAAMTTLVFEGDSMSAGGDGSQVVGSGSLIIPLTQAEELRIVDSSPLAGETVAISHQCFSPGPSIRQEQYQTTQVASASESSVTIAPGTSSVPELDVSVHSDLPAIPFPWMSNASEPAKQNKVLADGSSTPFDILDLFTYTREPLDGHFFRSRARISKFDPEEPCPGSLTLLHTLCSPTAFGITIQRFRQIFVRCSQCHSFAYTDNQTKHVCQGRSVRKSAVTAQRVYDCLVADASGGITMRQMQSVFAMCGGCERILVDDFGEFHTCNPDVSQDS